MDRSYNLMISKRSHSIYLYQNNIHCYDSSKANLGFKKSEVELYVLIRVCTIIQNKLKSWGAGKVESKLKWIKLTVKSRCEGRYANL